MDQSSKEIRYKAAKKFVILLQIDRIFRPKADHRREVFGGSGADGGV
jgi:hypothetical protein